MGDLDANWLSIELQSIDQEMANWPDGLKESFLTLLNSASSETFEASVDHQAIDDR